MEYIYMTNGRINTLYVCVRMCVCGRVYVHI